MNRDKTRVAAQKVGDSNFAPVRAIIVDSSSLARNFWTKALGSTSGIRVLPSLASVSELKSLLLQDESARLPDVVILHVSDAADASFTSIPKLIAMRPQLKIIVSCAHTPAGAMLAVKALTLGAVDSVFRPAGGLEGEVSADLARDLTSKVLLYRSKVKSKVAPASREVPSKKRKPKKAAGSLKDVLVVGCSTGGPQALQQFLSLLPKDVPVPVLVVQHMPPRFTTHLAVSLTESTGQRVSEARDGELLEPGRIFLAPGGYHMQVRRGSGGPRIALNQEPPENYCRPAVDQLFRSAASVFGKHLLAVVMTGVGEDGRRGAEMISQAGGLIYVQDEATSVVWGMPGAIARAGIAKEVLPIPGLVARVTRWLDEVRS